MLEDSTTISAMGRALATLLRPIVRFLLKHSFPYSAFEAIAKRVYAETAMTDFALPGRKPSVSRAAILTGLTRKDVHALLQEPWTAFDPGSTHYNRAARVVTAWVRDARFHDRDGAPRPLAMDGPEGFAELVRLHGGDVPVRAVLDELMRVGSIQPLVDGRLALRQRAFVPSEDMLLKLGILGTDVAELVDTVTHNLDPEAGEARFQRKVMHVGIPVEHLPAFHDLSSRKSQALLEALDAWLAAHDMGDVPESIWSPGSTAQVGVGIYYFQKVTSSGRPGP
jgi:hypothetical protein